MSQGIEEYIFVKKMKINHEKFEKRIGDATLARSMEKLMTQVLMVLVAGWVSISAAESVKCALADGFDFPVGKPDAVDYYKSRGFIKNLHPGEDWNGRGGGNSDYNDPIYSAAHGVVVLSEDIGVGWGNCVIIRHAYRDKNGETRMVDSLHAHLEKRLVHLAQLVQRGELVGTMGSNRGMYPVHLHYEIRHNLHIGMNRSAYPRDYNHYHNPTVFINEHRNLPTSFIKVTIPLGLFKPYGRGSFDLDLEKEQVEALKLPAGPKLSLEEPANGSDFWQKLREKLSQQNIQKKDEEVHLDKK
jgi:hypothetical protein